MVKLILFLASCVLITMAAFVGLIAGPLMFAKEMLEECKEDGWI